MEIPNKQEVEDISMKRIILTLTLLLAIPAILFAQGYQPKPVPEKIKGGEERLQYMARHYWDAYDFRDTTLLRTDYAEQAIVDYTALLQSTSPEEQRKAWQNLFNKAAKREQTERYFYATAVRYLDNRESPLYSPEMLELMLQAAQSSEQADISSKASFRLRLLSGNRVGQSIADFRIKTLRGEMTTLYGVLENKAALLLFYDPDCDDCKYAIYRIRHSQSVREAVAQKQMQVVAVCIGADEKLWRVACDEMPPSWTHALDKTDIRAQALYDLSELPRLYMVDSQHRVAAKDIDINHINEYLGFARARNNN